MFKEDSSKPSLPADVLWGSFVTHSWRNECLTNEPERTSRGGYSKPSKSCVLIRIIMIMIITMIIIIVIIILIIIINGKVMTKKSSKLSL